MSEVPAQAPAGDEAREALRAPPSGGAPVRRLTLAVLALLGAPCVLERFTQRWSREPAAQPAAA